MNNLNSFETVIYETHAPITACIIWLHGLGADGHDFANIVPELQLPSDLGIRFIFPHAPKRPVSLNNGFIMRAWYDIYSLQSLHQEDRAGVQASERTLNLLIQQQQALGIPSSRIILAGFSQGGALALYTGLRSNAKLGGILGLSTYLPLMADFASQPPTQLDLPIFLAHGAQDEVVPLRLAEKTRDFLTHAGFHVFWRTYPMAHQVCIPEIEDISAWLQKSLST